MKIQMISSGCLPDGMALQPGQQIDLPPALAVAYITAGKAEVIDEPYPTPMPEIEMRDPVIEEREPVIKRKRGRPRKPRQMPSERFV